jgi:hypothetical protein
LVADSFFFQKIQQNSRFHELTPTPLFAMSKAHLKRGAFSTGAKRHAKAPSFKAIFD